VLDLKAISGIGFGGSGGDVADVALLCPIILELKLASIGKT